MKSNLDIWAVQEAKEEIFTALEQIKGGLSIIYDKVACEIMIGSNNITNRLFDLFLYNEESDTLIMVMKGSKASKEDMIHYLEQHNLKYVEVTFLEEDVDNQISEKKEEVEVPELWFARDAYVLDDALDSSLERNVNSAVIMPNVMGDLSLFYTNIFGHTEVVDGRLFKGLVSLPDKLVLLVNQGDEKESISISTLEKKIQDRGFIYSIDESNDIRLSGSTNIRTR